MGGQVPPLILYAMRLDYYDIRPEGMDVYLSHYGYHFSKKMCEWAVSRMRDKNGKSMDFRDKESVEKVLSSYGVEIQNDYGYDKV